MAADIVRHLAATGRMANHDDIAKIQMLKQLCEIVRITIHIVAIPGLLRAPVAPAIMRNNPITLLAEEQHLVIPGV